MVHVPAWPSANVLKACQFFNLMCQRAKRWANFLTIVQKNYLFLIHLIYLYLIYFIYFVLFRYIILYNIHIHVFRPSQDSSVWLGLTSREQLMSPECSKHQALSFPVNIAKFVKTPISKNICKRLLL